MAHRIKPILKFVAAAIMPAIYLAFVITDHYDVWDEVRGLNDVKVVAARMNTSYEEVQRQYRPSDKEWKATVDLIKKYTKSQLPPGREPLVVMRYGAITSAKLDLGYGKFAEWTAPTTPLALLYHEFPTPGSIKPEDIVIVGQIGDLFAWIDKSKTDFRFFVQNVLLGIFSLTLAILIWGIEHRERKTAAKAP
jgi:hypothetical protein